MSRTNALIPSEQITACEFWKMDDFSYREIAAIERQHPTVEELQDIERQAHADGHAAGYQEGAQQVRDELSRLKSLVDQVDLAIERVDRDVADSLVTLAMEMARQLVKHSLSRDPTQIVDVVREAMQALPPFGEHVQLLINPSDAALVRSHMAEQIGRGKWTLIDDAGIECGGCRIRTASMQVDATLPTRWQRMAASLARDDAWYRTSADEGAEPT
jgi:flagellar assembly protein FliH